jgi:hypothetical protein
MSPRARTPHAISIRYERAMIQFCDRQFEDWPSRWTER